MMIESRVYPSSPTSLRTHHKRGTEKHTPKPRTLAGINGAGGDCTKNDHAHGLSCLQAPECISGASRFMSSKSHGFWPSFCHCTSSVRLGAIFIQPVHPEQGLVFNLWSLLCSVSVEQPAHMKSMQGPSCLDLTTKLCSESSPFQRIIMARHDCCKTGLL